MGRVTMSRFASLISSPVWAAAFAGENDGGSYWADLSSVARALKVCWVSRTFVLGFGGRPLRGAAK